MTDQKFAPFKFLHIYGRVSREWWISNKFIGRYFLGMCLITYHWSPSLEVYLYPGIPLITFLRAMACGSCEFHLLRLQGKCPSAKGLFYRLVHTVASNHWWIYTKCVNCYFTLTIKLTDIVATCIIYTGYVHAIPKFNCLGHASYSNSPNSILPKVV